MVHKIVVEWPYSYYKSCLLSVPEPAECRVGENLHWWGSVFRLAGVGHGPSAGQLLRHRLPDQIYPIVELSIKSRFKLK